LLETLKNII